MSAWLPIARFWNRRLAAQLESSVPDEGYGNSPSAASGLDPLVSLLRSEGFLGGWTLSTNILPLRGSWSYAMHARLKKVADFLPFNSQENRLWERTFKLWHKRHNLKVRYQIKPKRFRNNWLTIEPVSMET
jgi:hypothetical protein